MIEPPVPPLCAICHRRPASPDDDLLCDECAVHYADHGDELCPGCPPVNPEATP